MSYIMTAAGLTIVVDNKPYTINKSHHNYNKIVDAVKKDRMDLVPGLIDISVSMKQYSRGAIDVDINNQLIKYNGHIIHNCMVEKIFKMMNEGFNIGPMVKFLENLMNNPSKQAVDELYLFMESGQLPITEDGCFIAYKRVTSDYLDCHSKKVLNKPYDLITKDDIERCGFVYQDWCYEYTTSNGVTVTMYDVTQELVVSMLRNTVDDKRDNTCSEGLHFCSQQYLKSFSGGRTVLVKINPADVVSIPSDYNNTKGRTCKYIVVGELDADQHRLVDSENVLTESVYGKAADMDDMYSDSDMYNSDQYDEAIIEFMRDRCDEDDEYIGETEFDKYSDPIKTIKPTAFEQKRNGYLDGYSAGRSGSNKSVLVCDNDYQDGYRAGYSDGKGHKRKLYK